MTRSLALVAAIAAALVAAPAASAAAVTYTVNDPGSAADATAQANCTAHASGCTLPAAILAANANPGADTINFAVSPGPFSAPLPVATDAVTIDGGGNTTITFAGTAGGALLTLQAPDSTIKTITVAGGSPAATVVNLAGSGDHLDTVTVNAAGTGVQLASDSQRADAVHVTSSGGAGIIVSGPNATINTPAITSQASGIDISTSGVSVIAPEISGSSASGIHIGGDSNSVSGGHIHDNGGSGVAISGTGNVVSRVVFNANGGRPIALDPGANGGIAPPQNLRIGPRRPDGSLPLTGTATSPGTIELWSGDPSGPNPPGLLDTFNASGGFTYNFASEPAPGSVFAASLTSGGLGSSEFATVSVPSDVTSPGVVFARALDTSNVKVDFSEPLDPNSIQSQDFVLTMAGAVRTIKTAAPSADGRSVILTSSGWKAGEAGYVDFTGVGAVNDAAGNAMLTSPRIRVAAAPGDFIAPLGGRLAVTPNTICLTHGRNCRHPGMTIRFQTTEPGKATLLIKRSNVTVGKRLYGNIVAGTNTLKFNGRLGSRKLRAGRYRLLMYVQDQVGNITDQPPLVLFNVRRATK